MDYRGVSLSVKSVAIFLLLRMVFFHSTTLYANSDSAGALRDINDIERESLVCVQDTIAKKDSIAGRNNHQKQKGDIYLRLQNSAEKNFVTRKLYGLFFRKQDLEIAGRVFSKTSATEKFIGFTGKRINSIKLTRLNAFGQSVYDSTLNPTKWIENSANRLHVLTALFLIRNNLLFKEGELLNPVDFAESEQLLRNLNYIEDANILVESLADTSAVNINVITKDAWSIGLGAQYNNRYSSQFDVYDKNLGGLGVWLNGYFYHDSRYPNEWGQKGELNVTNIGGLFIDGDIWARKGLGYETYALALRRDFYASKALYGGGAAIIKSYEPYRFKSIDSTRQISYNGYDYWIGRSLRVSRRDLTKSPHNLVLAFRFISKYYSDRPSVSIDTNYIFQNKEYYLVGLSLTRQELYKANLIYSFGSTEDIPTGFRVNFSTGVERGEFKNRYYVGSELSAAEVGSWGYLFSSARTGGFISSYNQIQQTTVNIRATYFSNLFTIKNLQLRQFARIDFTRGLSRFYGEGEAIFLDDKNGIRGLTSRDMNGTTRLVVNLETVAFSPLFVFGFRFAYFGFCDFGFIGSADDYMIGNQSFSGFGLGVRIRNENLVLNTIQIRLGYYPKLPTNADVSYWLITGQQRTRFENFRAREPQIVPFE
jgi:hypothetical protein